MVLSKTCRAGEAEASICPVTMKVPCDCKPEPGSNSHVWKVHPVAGHHSGAWRASGTVSTKLNSDHDLRQFELITSHNSFLLPALDLLCVSKVPAERIPGPVFSIGKDKIRSCVPCEIW